jgi:urate oxidase
VLKSTGSAFEGFVRDEYTTLAEVNDRIFSTSVELAYTFAPLAIARHGDGRELDEGWVQGHEVRDAAVLLLSSADGGQAGDAWDDDAVAASARELTLTTFAVDESASVQVRAGYLRDCRACADGRLWQATLYKMGQAILAANAHVASVRIALPNKHYIPVDMKYIGLDNTTPCVLHLYFLLSASVLGSCRIGCGDLRRRRRRRRRRRLLYCTDAERHRAAGSVFPREDVRVWGVIGMVRCQRAV